MRRTGALLALSLAVMACDGDDDRSAATTTSSVAITEPPRFDGDPNSPFCQALEDDDDPIPNPFEPGIEPTDVRIRLREVRLRFDALTDVAPDDIAADLQTLSVALDALDSTLAEHGYDFDRAAAAGADLSAFDDPVFRDVDVRLGAYREQVCDAS